MRCWVHCSISPRIWTRDLLIAYRFGSLFLAAKPPEGAGRPDQALYLLERGIVANPAYWRLWEDLGFIYYWDLKDYARAAAAFQAGSQQPGALPWMRAMAASVAAQGGELQSSYRLWSEIARTAENEAMRRSAILHLAALQAQSDLNRVGQLTGPLPAKARPGSPLHARPDRGRHARKLSARSFRYALYRRPGRACPPRPQKQN